MTRTVGIGKLSDKKIIKTIVGHIGLFCGLLAVLYLALVCSAMIPNEALKDNFKKSADSYNDVAPYHFYNGEKWNGIADNYADIILLNVAWQYPVPSPASSVYGCERSQESGAGGDSYPACTYHGGAYPKKARGYRPFAGCLHGHGAGVESKTESGIPACVSVDPCTLPPVSVVGEKGGSVADTFECGSRNGSGIF